MYHTAEVQPILLVVNALGNANVLSESGHLIVSGHLLTSTSVLKYDSFRNDIIARADQQLLLLLLMRYTLNCKEFCFERAVYCFTQK